MPEYPHLFSPLKVGHMTVPNRIVSTAHQGRMHDGIPGDRHIAYHLAKIEGGLGIDVVFAIVSVHPTSPTSSDQAVAGWNDDCIAPFKRVTAALHAPGTGAALICQITHRGRRARSDGGEWRPAIAPSPVSDDLYRGVPHEMGIEDVDWLVDAYAATAARVRAGGFDGVEILGAYSHLVDQFWSPLDNLRADDYGGALDARMRFSRHVVDAVRAAVGSDFIVGLKISGDDMRDGGIDPAMARAIARAMAGTGKIDYINVIGSTNGDRVIRSLSVPGLDQPHGVFMHLASMIRSEVAIPVMATGRIVTPGEAEAAIAEGKADLVGMTRAILADPNLPRKAAAGRVHDIRYCTGCNEGCIGRNYEGQSVICIQNPEIGRERELGRLIPAARPETVVVIGGGVAGMEAARVAALRGHRVVLFERSDRLGGQVLLAARAPKRGEYIGNARWLEQQITALSNVEIRLGHEATVESVFAARPATVVVATGARTNTPALPGLDGPNIMHAEAVFARVSETAPRLDAIHPALRRGTRVVVVDEEGYAKGLGVADLFATLGCDVDFVTSQYMPGQQLPDMPRVPILRSLYAHNVTFRANLVLQGVDDRTVRCKQFFADHFVTIDDVDLVVLSYQPRAEDTLLRQLQGSIARLESIGDCVAPRSVASAILEGTLVGRAV